MSESLKTEIVSPKGHDIWIPCSHCGKVTCHHALAAVKTSDESPDGDIRIWDDYFIVQCGGCRTVSFCVQGRNSEDVSYDHRGNEEPIVRNQVYPSRIAGRSELENSYLLPFSVRVVYEETRTALANNQPVLAGIGIRAIVETVCKERSATGKNLMKKIDSLATKGIVTQDGAKILHSLRFMGNDAAHETKAHSEADLITALEVVEYVLKGVYILPKLADKLPRGRAGP